MTFYKKIILLLAIVFCCIPKADAQSGQVNLSVDILNFNTKPAFNIRSEFGLKPKIGLFVDLLYEQRDGIGPVIGFDSISFGPIGPVPITDKFDVNQLTIAIGSNFYFGKKDYFNKGFFGRTFFDFRQVLSVEDGFTYTEGQKGVIGWGIGWGYKHIFKDWTLELSVDNKLEFDRIPDSQGTLSSDISGHLRVGYLFNAQKIQESRKSSRRRRSR